MLIKWLPKARSIIPNNMKSTTIHIPIFFGRLTIVSVEYWKDFDEKYNTNAALYGYEGLFYYIQEMDEYVLAIKNTDWSVIAHEAIHCVNRIMKECNIHHSYDNDETQAYLMGWVISEVDKFLNNK